MRGSGKAGHMGEERRRRTDGGREGRVNMEGMREEMREKTRVRLAGKTIGGRGQSK